MHISTNLIQFMISGRYLALRLCVRETTTQLFWRQKHCGKYINKHRHGTVIIKQLW